MSLFCHPIILLTIGMLMTLSLTFSFPLAVHSVRHSFVDATLTSLYGCLPTTSTWALTRENCSSFKAFSALCEIFPSSLATPLWPLAACQQFHCNSWQPPVIHQTSAIANTSHTCILVLHISQFRASPMESTHLQTLCLEYETLFGLGFISHATPVVSWVWPVCQWM